jgi:protein SERAC1
MLSESAANFIVVPSTEHGLRHRVEPMHQHLPTCFHIMGNEPKETFFKFGTLKTRLGERFSRHDAAGGNSSTTDSATAAPYGVHVWADCADATIDICFIHGLTGDHDRTWTANTQHQPWPKTLLAPELNSARILTYGYDAYVIGKGTSSQNRLTDHAQNLVNDLTTNRWLHGASTRPIVFVAHSLGGIVCKKAVLLSHGYPDSDPESGVFKCTKGIIFMGTPHRGAWMSNWARIPVTALGIVKSTNTKLLKALGSGEELLGSIQHDFGHLLRRMAISKTPIEITCFYEELPLLLAGTVVSRDSATIPPYNAISIHANHREMARFSSTEDRGFIEVSALIKKWRNDVG